MLENLDAKVQQLSAQSRGELDINTGEFRFPLDISMSDFSAGIEGCVEVDKVWRKRAIPLRCKGNIANIGAKTCLPDGPRITEYIKDEAKQAVKKEVDKAKSKAEDKIKEALEKNLDSEQVDSIKGALKGLFGR